MTEASPWADPARISRLQEGFPKALQFDPSHAGSRVRTHLRAAAELGRRIEPPMRVLDVGCGAGDTVAALLEQGFDAHGIDVLEIWGRDFRTSGQDRPRPSGPHLPRLHVVDCNDYRLPFPRGFFDFAFSDQVFEHVFNYEAVFREIARVLKPGAISVHEFPGVNSLLEGHINVPLTALCRFKSYLAFWAFIGRRSPRQTGLGWRETLELNVETMKLSNYPLKRTLRHHARRAGVKVEFDQLTGIRARETGRLSSLLRRLPPVLRGACEHLATFVCQRYMILYGSA